jgi:hypothetical protein
VGLTTGEPHVKGNRIMGLLDNAKDAVNSDKGEQVSDTGIDKAEDAVSDKTGGKIDGKIDKAGDAADGKIGNE